jgi:hypothetical protein
MHLDIVYVLMHNKIYEPRKAKKDLQFGTKGVFA